MKRICSQMICNSWNKSWHRTPPCCSTVPLVSNRCPDPAERQQPTQSPALHSWEQPSTNGRSKGSNLLLKCMINIYFLLTRYMHKSSIWEYILTWDIWRNLKLISNYFIYIIDCFHRKAVILTLKNTTAFELLGVTPKYYM